MRDYFASKETKAKKQMESKRTQRALDFLDKWGGRFFEDVECRTVEVIQRFEQELKKEGQSTLGGGFDLAMGPLKPDFSADRSTSRSESDSESVQIRQEFIERAKRIVDQIQVQELGGILELLEEVLHDPQKPCYIAIDQLDESWAEDEIRLRLLKGLLDTVREFGKVHNAKVIICLRIDLLEQLFYLARSESGFQEDKYRSLYLPLRWTNSQLEHLLNKRVAKLIRDAYTNYEPRLEDIVPNTLQFGRKIQIRTLEYLLERTWGRPRDAIEFLNACIAKSEGKATISKDAILDAEGEYSRAMLRAIATEWHARYPHLQDAVKKLLTNRRAQFKLSEFADSELEDWSLTVACSDNGKHGKLYELASRAQKNELALNDLRREIAAVFYKAGCIGLKTSAIATMRWATSESYSVSTAEIDESSSIRVHPGLWRVLGIVER